MVHNFINPRSRDTIEKITSSFNKTSNPRQNWILILWLTYSLVLTTKTASEVVTWSSWQNTMSKRKFHVISRSSGSITCIFHFELTKSICPFYSILHISVCYWYVRWYYLKISKQKKMRKKTFLRCAYHHQMLLIYPLI